MTAHWVMKYLGAPWKAGQSGPDAYDCWGLVRAVYSARYGIQLPIIDVDATSAIDARRAMIRSENRTGWDPVDAPADGVVALMSHGKTPHHVGIVVALPGGMRLLHAVEGAGVVLQSIQDVLSHGWKIQGYYARHG